MSNALTNGQRLQLAVRNGDRADILFALRRLAEWRVVAVADLIAQVIVDGRKQAIEDAIQHHESHRS